MLTIQDLKDRYGSEYIAGYDNAEAAALDASEIVAGYISTRYPWPLPSVPGILKAAAADIARRRLYTTDAPQDVLDAEGRALKMLRDISTGLANLPITLTQPGDPTDESEGILYESAPLRLTTRQTGLVF